MRKKKPKKKISDVVAPVLEALKTEDTEQKTIEPQNLPVEMKEEPVEHPNTTKEDEKIIEVKVDEAKLTKEAEKLLEKTEERPPVIIERSEVLNSLEGQTVEIYALIDANPAPNSNIILIFSSLFSHFVITFTT
jgi:hypothetical protein